MVDKRLWSQLLLKNNMAEGIKWQDNVSTYKHKFLHLCYQNIWQEAV